MEFKVFFENKYHLWKNTLKYNKLIIVLKYYLYIELFYIYMCSAVVVIKTEGIICVCMALLGTTLMSKKKKIWSLLGIIYFDKTILNEARCNINR